MTRLRFVCLLMLIAAAAAAPACKKKPPVTGPTTPPPVFPGAVTPSGSGGTTTPSNPGAPPVAPPVPTSGAVTSDPLANASIDDINRAEKLKPVFYHYDSDELDETARKTLEENAKTLKTYATWVITVEGHCDERGSAEYNLALGDRRALAAKNYLLTLGIAAERIKTVSYGKEFPFDPARTEAAFEKNRRAQFMVTAR